MKNTVAGVGYVGLSLTMLLAQRHEVTSITTEAKAGRLNRRESPIQDDENECFEGSLVVIDHKSNIGPLVVHRCRATDLDVGYLPGKSMKQASCAIASPTKSPPYLRTSKTSSRSFESQSNPLTKL